MRTEQEMYDLILGYARCEPRIRAVCLGGSRADPRAKKDLWQDYDILYVVTETEPFLQDRGWLARFGEPAIVQEPDRMDTLSDPSAHFDSSKRYAWLMLFRDGNRIDLTIATPEEAQRSVREEPLTVVLLDKDGLLPSVPPASDEAYWVQPPTEGRFFACCNEFWWCLNNVGKGIARDELPYVMQMYGHYVRAMLDRMTDWRIGMAYDFRVSAGKLGKYYRDLLPPALYERYRQTYCSGDYARIWEAVFCACDLFHDLALEVAGRFGYPYCAEDEEQIRIYLRRMREIRPD